MQAMKYEMFIRSAFGLKVGGTIGRWEDPAQLANTDAFMDNNLSSIKCVIGYSMEIFNHDILNNVRDIEIDEYNRINAFTDRVIAVTSLLTLSGLIDEYQSTVVDKYFNTENGIITLK